MFKANSRDQINMTKSFSQQQTLTIEHDQKIRQQQRLTFLLLLVSHLRLSQKKDTALPPKNMVLLSDWTGPPALAHNLTLARTPALPR